MKKLKVIILRNEHSDDHLQWENACNRNYNEIDYRVVNLTLNNWLEELHKQSFDILLAKPGGMTGLFKQLYDERIYILGQIIGYKIFPTPEEIFIYENKRFLSFWLMANKIPHPKTHVFYSNQEAQEFLSDITYPIVAKTNIGASGSGVTILNNRNSAFKYVDKTFFGKGAPQRYGPNFARGGLSKRGLHYLIYPQDIFKKLRIYKTKKENPQQGFVIFQEFIPNDFEWRVVRIGDSFFAHKKIKLKELASGSLKKKYENPPHSLLDFVKDLTDQHQFYSQAIDIFESGESFLINEMQCIFGQSDSYQMLVNNKPGRYRFIGGAWEFEEGEFATNACFDLRLQHIIDSFKK